MIRLDVADLVVIASEVLGCDTGAALAQADVTAAEEALAQAGMARMGRASARTPGEPSSTWPGGVCGTGPGGASPQRTDASEAAVALMDSLLRHPPFPRHREQMAVAAGLQFLAVNGWQANLDVAPGCGDRHRSPLFRPAHPGASRILAGGPAVSGLRLACRAGAPARHAVT